LNLFPVFELQKFFREFYEFRQNFLIAIAVKF
jgi:hypothetical protein